jgi:class 3 adenylate cyclase
MLVFDTDMGRWRLSDLRSTNGTHLNEVRVNGVTDVRSGDVIRIGSIQLVFHCDDDDESAAGTAMGDETILSVEKSLRWLIMADVKNSTRLMQELPEGELTRRVRGWIKLCEPVIDRSHGVINEFLGDGFVAFWRADRNAAGNVTKALKELETLQTADNLEFRVIVHHCEVLAGGAVSSGLDKLAGPEVNFLFKSEKAVRDAKPRVILTQQAADSFRDVAPVEKLLTAEVTGFTGERDFFGFS